MFGTTWSGAQSLTARDSQAAQTTPEPAAAAVARDDAQVLFREVMSPFCPGLTLADCPSPAAFELRRDIEARLSAGESRQAIVDELVSQYGTAILSDPSNTPIGRVVWGVPFVLSAVAAVGLAIFVRRATRTRQTHTREGAEEPKALRDRVDEELAAID